MNEDILKLRDKLVSNIAPKISSDYKKALPVHGPLSFMDVLNTLAEAYLEFAYAIGYEVGVRETIEQKHSAPQGEKNGG